jgi:Flp pilus assembly protein TadG
VPALSTGIVEASPQGKGQDGHYVTLRMFGRARGEARGQSIVEFALLAPIMIFMLFAILDLARIYGTMTSVESAARESADYGTQFGATKWKAADVAATVDEMEFRACVATSDLPDYEGSASTCTNPAFACAVTAPDFPTVGVNTEYSPCESIDDTAGCSNEFRPVPCRVTVTLTFDFDLFVPLRFDFFGVTLGLPTNLTFTRDSTFAMTDFDAPPTPEPTPIPPTDPPTPEPTPEVTPEITPEPPTPEPEPTATPAPEPTPTPEPSEEPQ